MVADKTITSISKGCFLFKPTPPCSPSKKRRKSSNHSSVKAVDYISCFVEETSGERAKRFEMFESCWQNIEAKIMLVQLEMNERIFDDIFHFVSNSYERNCEQRSPISEVPTAALVTGVNLPDHNTVFKHLVNLLTTRVTPYVASVQAKDCPNLKSMLKAVISFFVNTANKCLVDVSSNIQTHLKEYTFSDLENWYKANDIQILSGKNRKKDSSSVKVGPLLVVMIEDFERFTPAVLQDFILICSEHTNNLPIVILLGIATTVGSIHQSLPHFVSSHLSVEKFQAQPSLVCLTEVIDQVLLTDDIPFKLGPSVFRLFFENFLYHDFSIKNFIKGLKLAMMDHFYGNRFSILCCMTLQEVKSFVKRLNHTQTHDLMREVPSFIRYIEKKCEKDKLKLESDDKMIKSVVVQLITQLKTQETIFFSTVKCLHAVTRVLPGQPFGKRLRDTYEYCTVSKNITKESSYANAMQLVRFLSRDELLAILHTCIEICERNTGNETLQSNVVLMKPFLARFHNLDNFVPEKHEGKPSCAGKVYKNRYEFQENLKNSVKERRKESPYEKLRNEIVNTFDAIFKKNLISPLSLPFNEIFYFNDIHSIKRLLHGAPRLAIQKALEDPAFYLKCKCCSGEEKGIIQDTHPDVCILYKLHLECGKLINMYDWLQAFMTVLQPSLVDSKRKKSAAMKKLLEQLQARFIRGVAELQFLGFIKATQKKTDHVSRLTWGGC